jgi:hypothetical protein
MIALDERSRHEEVWLLLPWLTNGRLQPAVRTMAEEHVRQCAECEQELARQHLISSALTEPDRVIYAPGPSFRKLLERIDREDVVDNRTGDEGATSAVPQRGSHPSGRSLTARLSRVSLWRPPGLAWAASFIILFGITGMMVTAYRLFAPVYTTHTRTDTLVAPPNVLHIALDRSLPIGEVEDVLRTGGARIVDGPDSTGVLGVTAVGIVNGQTPEASANQQMRTLSARLRKDPRVLWVEPSPAYEGTPAEQRAQDDREH